MISKAGTSYYYWDEEVFWSLKTKRVLRQTSSDFKFLKQCDIQTPTEFL